MMDARHDDGLTQRYAELFEFAPEAYVVTDLHGSITEANRAAVELLRTSSGVLPGRTLIDFVPLERRKSFRERLVAVLADGGRQRQSWRGRLQPGEGRELVVEFSVGGVTNPDTGLARLCWLLRPVS
jgi:PAS domain S-box-containing protein